MTEKLLNCPFCSHVPFIIQPWKDMKIGCSNKMCCIWDIFIPFKEWNTRVESESYKKLIHFVKQVWEIDFEKTELSINAIKLGAITLLKEIEALDE